MTERQPDEYPWPGRRLAPITLRDCLLVPLPADLARDESRMPCTLADLDASAWDIYTPEQCAELAEAIVTRVREQARYLIGSGPLAERRLPPLPSGMSLADLGLSVRTFNALLRSPLGGHPERLRSATVEDVLDIRGMGAKGLIQLLVALEEVRQDISSADDGVDGTSRVECLADDARPGDGEAMTEPAPDAFVGGLTEHDVGLLGAWTRGELDSLPRSVLHRRLPAIPEATHVLDLGLASRTVGAITRAGHEAIGHWLRDAMILDILALPSFGRTAFGDLLDGIVRLMLQPPPSEDLTQLALALAESDLSALFAGDDPRLFPDAATVCRPGETVREAALRLSQRPVDPLEVRLVVDRVRRLLAALQRFERQSLEDELTEIATSLSDGRQGGMFARYRGWDGRGGAVLQAVGDEFGVSRERVRQVCSKVETRVRALRLAAPVLGRVVAVAGDFAPIWADELVRELQDRQLIAGTFAPEALIEAAAMLGIDAPIRIDEVAGRARVCLADDESAAQLDRLARLVRRIGRRTVEHWGVGLVSDVVAAATRESGDDVGERFVLDILTRDDGFRWLHQSRGWYWNAEVPRNRLTNQIDKVLRVAPQISVTQLQAAVARNYRMEGQAPPVQVLAELCRQLPNRLVDGDVVRAEPRLHPIDVLADTELLFYEILDAGGSVMTRADLEESCRLHGMNRATFYVYLGNSPILVSPRRGIYALVGAPVSPDRIAELAIRRQRGRVLVAAGRHDAKTFWTLYCLSEGMMANGAFSVPSGMKPFIEGDYTLRTSSGDLVGSLSSREHGSWGLGPCLRRLQAQPGQYLTIYSRVLRHWSKRLHLMKYRSPAHPPHDSLLRPSEQALRGDFPRHRRFDQWTRR